MTYSIAQTEKGKEIIKNAISIKNDKNGNPESYSVYFKGLDKTYTITKEELAEGIYLKWKKREEE
jgi:hypothetical protein